MVFKNKKNRFNPAHTHTTILEIIQDTILLDRQPSRLSPQLLGNLVG